MVGAGRQGHLRPQRPLRSLKSLIDGGSENDRFQPAGLRSFLTPRVIALTDKPILDLIIKNAAQVLTCAEGSPDGIGLAAGLDIGLKDGTIAGLAKSEDMAAAYDLRRAEIIDASGKTVLPGFVDCHTHLVFGGSRIDEYSASLEGLSREEMAARGIKTGLAASTESTRRATDRELTDQALARLGNMLSHGTTTAEIKSGYGLNTETELRQLRVIRQLQGLQPVTLHPTFLGGHAWPPDMDKSRYINLLLEEMIPRAAEENLAEFCDIWCDDGYYTADECRMVLTRAREFGLSPKIHTEAYSLIGGGELAAEMKMVSADHLNYAPESVLRKLAEAGVIGVLLPGTDFCVNHPRPFQYAPMRAAGLKAALATNLNPGCWIESLRTIMILACRRHGMTPAEAVVAATRHGAAALGVEHLVGSLSPGKTADLQIWDTDDYRTAFYQLDREPMLTVLKSGRTVFSRPSGS